MAAFSRDVELIVDGITEASEEVLARSRVGRTLTEVAGPEGALEVTRAWRDIDRVMGPGKTVLDVLATRYPRVSEAVEELNKLVRQGLKRQSPAAHTRVLNKMEAELKAYRALKSKVLEEAEASVDVIRGELRADFAQEFTKGKKTITRREAAAECRKALDELEQTFEMQRDAVRRGLDARAEAVAAKKRAEAMLIEFKKTKQTGERAAMSYRIRRFAQHKNAQELAADFSRRVKRQMRRSMPALHDIEDTGLVFMEALGTVESARPDMAKLLRRYAEGAELTEAELMRVRGTVGNLLGLMPEEVAMRMGFCDGLFHKAAFEILADMPPNVRRQLGVEIVRGPLWVNGSQFGDGCMLLTGPGGQSAIVGLGEFKAGFDKDLLTQLFQRSDKRAINATVSFLDTEGKVQVRQLTREFKLEGVANPVRISKPPIYVHGAPRGQAAETAAQFKEMLEQQMVRGHERELLKVQLPFEAAANQRFAEVSLKEAVNTLKKINPKWGL
jgi:hypothetical protein